MEQALENTVHKAGVAMIAQAQIIWQQFAQLLGKQLVLVVVIVVVVGDRMWLLLRLLVHIE